MWVVQDKVSIIQNKKGKVEEFMQIYEKNNRIFISYDNKTYLKFAFCLDQSLKFKGLLLSLSNSSSLPPQVNF